MRILLFLLLLPQVVISQNISLSGYVKNDTGNALNYVNVVSFKKTIGTSTDDNGFFTITVDRNDSIKFSHIAYISRVIAADNFNSDTIVLKESYKNLQGVIVKGSSSNNNLKVGLFNKNHKSGFKLVPGNQVAVFIDNPKSKSARIKSITFEVKSGGECRSVLRLRLLKHSTNNFAPGQDLLTDNYLIDNTKLLKQNTVDISKSNVYLPPEGIFVVVEWIGSELNCDKKSFPILGANTNTKENLVWFNYRDRKWTRPETFLLTRQGFSTPNIYLTVSF